MKCLVGPSSFFPLKIDEATSGAFVNDDNFVIDVFTDSNGSKNTIDATNSDSDFFNNSFISRQETSFLDSENYHHGNVAWGFEKFDTYLDHLNDSPLDDNEKAEISINLYEK